MIKCVKCGYDDGGTGDWAHVCGSIEIKKPSMKIYKYTLEVTDQQTVMLPPGSRVLSAKEQNGALCMWAMVDPTGANSEPYTFYIVGTGNPMSLPPDAVFVDTVVMSYIPLVWHVFYDRK